MRRTGILAGLAWVALSTVVLAGEGDADRYAAMLAADPLAGSIRLSRLADEGLPVIEELLESDAASVRRGAALTAGRMGERAAALRTALLTLLADPDPAVRTAAVWAIPRVSPEEFPPELPATLGDPSVAVRLASAAAFEIYGKAALPALRRAASSPERRGAALRALVGLRERAWLARHPDGTAEFEALSADERAWAEVARLLAAEDQGETRARWDGFRGGIPVGLPEELVRIVLHRVGSGPNVPTSVLVELALDPRPNLRFEAVTRLKARWIRKDSLPAAECLRRCLSDPDEGIRQTAVEGLAGGGPAGHAMLLDVLETGDVLARRMAARALDPHRGWRNTPSGFTPAQEERRFDLLIAALGDPDVELRRIAIGSLVYRREDHYPERVVSALLGRLADPDPGVADRAVGAFVVASKEPLPELLGLLASTDPEMRLRVLLRLARMGREAESALPLIRPLLGSPDPSVRAAAANALAAVAGDLDAAVPVLADILENGGDEARLIACLHLSRTSWDAEAERLGGWKALARARLPIVLKLSDLYRDEDGDLGLAAARALRDLGLGVPLGGGIVDFPAVAGELEAMRLRAFIGSPTQSGASKPLSSATWLGGGLRPWAAIRELMRMGARDERTVALLEAIAGGADPILADWARLALSMIDPSKEDK